MNKQKLATKIWESANKMRSKIEANEYKDIFWDSFFTSIFQIKKSDLCKAKELQLRILKT